MVRRSKRTIPPVNYANMARGKRTKVQTMRTIQTTTASLRSSLTKTTYDEFMSARSSHDYSLVSKKRKINPMLDDVDKITERLSLINIGGTMAQQSCIELSDVLDTDLLLSYNEILATNVLNNRFNKTGGLNAEQRRAIETIYKTQVIRLQEQLNVARSNLYASMPITATPSYIN